MSDVQGIFSFKHEAKKERPLLVYMDMRNIGIGLAADTLG